MLTTTDGSLGLDCEDELWREREEFSWHFPNAALGIVVVLRFLCSEDGVVQADTQRDLEKLADGRLEAPGLKISFVETENSAQYGL